MLHTILLGKVQPVIKRDSRIGWLEMSRAAVFGNLSRLASLLALLAVQSWSFGRFAPKRPWP